MIKRIDLKHSNHGGRQYEKLIDDIFYDNVKPIYILKKNLYYSIISFLWQLISLKFFSLRGHILTFQTIFFANLFKKNILIIHHIDINYKSRLLRLYYNSCFYYLRCNKNRFSQIIVVSEYWKNYLENLGLTNIKVIYNSFNIEEYKNIKFNQDIFKEKHGFTSYKPILYIGTLKANKGFDKVQKILENYNYQLCVTSSNEIKIEGLICLNLNKRDYIKLLFISDIVIAMSEFLEGWNRTIHEAILCNKKVIGSGSGGMKELLIMEDRLICEDIQDLPQLIELYLRKGNETHPKVLQKFNLDYFKNEWSKVLLKLTE